MEQVDNHKAMIEELNKSVISISADIKGLLHQTASLDKALSQLASNQATLLSMSAGKPQTPNVVGMNSIIVKQNDPPTIDEILGELMNYTEFLGPIMSKLTSEFLLKRWRRKKMKLVVVTNL